VLLFLFSPTKKKKFLVQNEDIKDICLALPCLALYTILYINKDDTGQVETSLCNVNFVMAPYCVVALSFNIFSKMARSLVLSGPAKVWGR
jgi:hypothetical protein